jgi:hypothetical protein
MQQLLQQDEQLIHVERFGQHRAALPLQIAAALLQGAPISRAHQDRRRVEHGVVPEVYQDLPAGRGVLQAHIQNDRREGEVTQAPRRRRAIGEQMDRIALLLNRSCSNSLQARSSSITVMHVDMGASFRAPVLARRRVSR